jgi:8-hydroxy-5-deazaflavin:NADPH oxidoreductase
MTYSIIGSGGQRVIPQTLEAALRADIVILAVPFSAVADIAHAESDWMGRIVIDATNAINFPAYTPTDLGGRRLSRRFDRGRRTPRTLHFRK